MKNEGIAMGWRRSYAYLFVGIIDYANIGMYKCHPAEGRHKLMITSRQARGKIISLTHTGVLRCTEIMWLDKLYRPVGALAVFKHVRQGDR